MSGFALVASRRIEQIGGFALVASRRIKQISASALAASRRIEQISASALAASRRIEQISASALAASRRIEPVAYPYAHGRAGRYGGCLIPEISSPNIALRTGSGFGARFRDHVGQLVSLVGWIALENRADRLTRVSRPLYYKGICVKVKDVRTNLDIDRASQLATLPLRKQSGERR